MHFTPLKGETCILQLYIVEILETLLSISEKTGMETQLLTPMHVEKHRQSINKTNISLWHTLSLSRHLQFRKIIAEIFVQEKNEKGEPNMRDRGF